MKEQVEFMTTIPQELWGVLKQYASIFDMPIKVPPERNKQHQIVFKEGTNSVSATPIYIPSYSEGRNHKIDGWHVTSWHHKTITKSFFKTDVISEEKGHFMEVLCGLQALKKETVTDKHPIPVIEELLDELHWA